MNKRKRDKAIQDMFMNEPYEVIALLDKAFPKCSTNEMNKTLAEAVINNEATIFTDLFQKFRALVFNKVSKQQNGKTSD